MAEAEKGDRSRDRDTRLDSDAVGDAAVPDAPAAAESGVAVVDAQIVRVPFVPSALFHVPGRDRPCLGYLI